MELPHNSKNNYRDPWSNFNIAYRPSLEIPFNGTRPNDMFDNHNFKNQGGLIHNDIYDNVLNEWVREYSIYIDSKDRDFKVYPNPFKYTVDFSPPPATRISDNGESAKLEPIRPFIKGPIKDVRYIKLETAILPIYHRINDDGTLNIKDKLKNRIYNILQIKEFYDENRYSTSQELEDSFAILYPDSDIHDQKIHFQTKTRNGGVYYFPPDTLGEIKKMTIRITDPYGTLYQPDVDPKIDTPSHCICNPDPDMEANNKCFIHSLYHPGNPIFQNHLHFRVGVVIPRINKKIFN